MIEAQSVSDVISGLHNLSTCPSNEIAYVASKTEEYINALVSRQLTKLQFDELISDLNIDQLVASTAGYEEDMSTLTTLLDDLKTILISISPNILL